MVRSYFDKEYDFYLQVFKHSIDSFTEFPHIFRTNKYTIVFFSNMSLKML